jgi:hypothetical protein
MGRTLGVGVVLLIALCLLPGQLQAQAAEQGRGQGFQLRQNYPNPFNPQTFIPFDLDVELFEGGRRPVVTIRIFNVFRQLVAIPTALNHPDGNGVRVENLTYTAPGPHVAFWDGTDRDGRKVASAVYFVQLEVNGHAAPPRRMLVTK